MIHTTLTVATAVRVVAGGLPPSDLAGTLAGQFPWSRTVLRKSRDGVRQSVLVVDDEDLIADSLVMILERHGYTASAQYSGAGALKHIEEECPDIIIADVVMPDMNGVQLAIQVRTHCPDSRILLISGNVATSNLLKDQGEGHFFEVLAKPVHPLDLLKSLQA
jgi:CheY-like chemotaxis protein